MRLFSLLFCLILFSCTDGAEDYQYGKNQHNLQVGGLIHHWTLDGNANDSVGTQHGTVVGATTVAGEINDALYFDGTDYADLGVMNVTSNNISVMAWVNAVSWGGGSGDGRIFSVATGTAEQDHQLMLSALNGQHRCRISTGGNTTSFWGGTATTGVWQHVACTYDGVRARLYVDGIEVASRSRTGSVTLNLPANIGRNPDGSRYIDATIDDVRIYNESLSPEQILQVMDGDFAEVDASVPPAPIFDSGVTTPSNDSGTTEPPVSIDASIEPPPVSTDSGTINPPPASTDSGVIDPPPPPPQTDAGVGQCIEKVTFIISGDFGYPGDNVNSKFQSWLNMVSAISSVGNSRYVLLASGDLAYEETTPTAWMNLLTANLPNVAIIASRGNHEDDIAWSTYTTLINQHNAAFPWLHCTGDYGRDSLCEVDGVSVVTSDIVQLGWREKLPVLQSRLATVNPDNWKICNWHETLENFTVGSKFSTTPEEAYEACRDAGAMVVTAHDHAYTRSCTVTDFYNPGLNADCSNPVRVGNGETFVTVSGRGGRNMSATTAGRESRSWNGAFVTTSGSLKNGVFGSGNTDPGALFVTFDGSDIANAVYIDSALRQMDSFTIQRQ